MQLSTSGTCAMGLLIGACALSAFLAVRTLLGQLRPLCPSLRAVVLAGVAAGFLALGCRLCVAEGFVSWAPYLDQWHAEISGVAVPLAHGTLGLGDMVAGNNEHRVILTRAVSLSCMLLDGSWDNRPLVVVNYLLESCLVGWVCALAWGSVGWARGSVVAAMAILPMALVSDWETIISSNQMQFVFMAFGSVIALSLAHDFSRRSPGAWAAFAIAALMLASMASGFLTAASLAATAVVVAIAERRSPRGIALFCAACAALVAVGWLTRVDFTALYPIYAKSAGGWFRAFIMYAGWPLSMTGMGAVVLWAPWAVLLATTLYRRAAAPLAPFAIGLGIWALLQSCALGFARAGFLGTMSSRYTEFLGWDIVANAAALAILAGSGTRGRRAAAWAAILAWAAWVAAAEVRRSEAFRPDLVTFREQTREHEQRLGTFMRTGDARVIESVGFPRIPYNAVDILPVLRDRSVLSLLPAPLRRDVVRDSYPALLASAEDGPFCFLAIRVLASGRLFLGAGALLLLAAAALSRFPAAEGRRRSPEPTGTGPAFAWPPRPGRSPASAQPGGART
jgi:hypothetical protein